MERLVECVPQLASARTVSEIVDIVRRVARELTGADGATFILRDEDRCYYVDEDAIGPLWRGQRFPMESCISGWAMIHRDVVAIEDIYADDRIPHDAYRPTFVKSLAMVPIRTTDPIGAIGNYWASHHVATGTELRLLQALADSTAVALENVRLVDELEDRVAQRTAALSSAYEDLQQFAAGVAHDLRSPLQGTIGFLELLTERKGDVLDGQARKYLAAAERGARSMGALIDDLLAYSRTGSAPLEIESIDVGEVVSDVVERLESQIAERGARVEVGTLPRVDADASLLSVTLQNLLVNAIAYGVDGKGSRVVVEGRGAPDGWMIDVRDHGPGVPDAEKAVIFDAFRRGHEGRDHPGTGLGLAITRRAVERHGGRIEVSDAPGGGACFTVVLPRSPAPVG